MVYDIFNKRLRAKQDLAGTLKGEGITDTSLGTALVQVGHIGQNRMAERVYSPNGLAVSIRGEGGGWGGKPGGLYLANALDADGYLRVGTRPRDKNGKPQLLPIGYRRIRRLTPLECERLQGFPDGWTEGISDVQRYKCLGNAVTTNVITAIGTRMLEELSGYG